MHYLQIEDKSEFNAILAALRTHQAMREGAPEEIADIETDGGSQPALDDDAIDALCERLNCGGLLNALPANAPAKVYTLVIDTDNGTSTHVFGGYRAALDFLAADCRAVDKEFSIDGLTDEEARERFAAHFEKSSDWYVLNECELEDAATAQPPVAVIGVQGGTVQWCRISQPDMVVYVLDGDNDDADKTLKAMPFIDFVGGKFDYEPTDVAVYTGESETSPAYCRMVAECEAVTDTEGGGRYACELQYQWKGALHKWTGQVRAANLDHARGVAILTMGRETDVAFPDTAVRDTHIAII